jgi:hypothetical protein
MQHKGINYDVGTRYYDESSTRPVFDLQVVRREIGIIQNELHCNSIRISGDDVSRLIAASEMALETGLSVWLSPTFINQSQEKTLQQLLLCAGEAEKLRVRYQHLLLVAGCEASLFIPGIVAGSSIHERIAQLFSPLNLIRNLLHLDGTVQKKINAYLKCALEQCRSCFKGSITYASGIWERISWEPFDIVGIDHYRASYNHSRYRQQLRKYRKFNKPVAVLEFGCCTYQGADAKGGYGWAIVNWEGEKPAIKGAYQRDEKTQSIYILDLLNILNDEEVLGAFVFTFSNPLYIHHLDPQYDLDMASYGIVAPLPEGSSGNYQGLSWRPKEAFHAIAGFYAAP